MENNPLSVMYAEHDIIVKAESIIESLNKVWENDEEKYKEVVVKLITFFREYADGYHHRKEEEVLFPAVYNHPDFVLQGIIDEFEQHHESFRDYAQEVETAIAEGNFEKSYKELNNYLQDLLDHIGAENDELFALAESLMDDDELETIFFKFKDIDMELGEDRKIELEKSIDAITI
jgi:hemerythrin-like domain-containing protein